MGIVGGGVAAFPVAGFDLTALSEAPQSPSVFSDPSVRRVFLLRATPTGQTVDIASETVHTDGKRFPSALSHPYNFSVSLPFNPVPIGGAQLGVADLPISNPDGDHDALPTYDWLAADCPIWLGPRGARPPDQNISEFQRIFRGTSEGVVYGPDVVRVLQRDFRFRLQKRLEPRRYWGFGACLRFDGSGDWVDYGDILDQGASSSFTVEILFQSSVTGTAKGLASKKNSAAAGDAGWRFRFDGSDQIQFTVSDGVDQVSATSGDQSANLDGKLRRAIAVVDRVAQEIRVYIDGTLVVTSGDISAVGDLSNTIAMQVGTTALNAGSWNGELDDFRFWSGARLVADIQADMHRELTGTESGLEVYTKYNEGSGTNADDSTSNNRDGTITGATWVGTLEGDSSVAGQPKPRAYGKRRQITPVLVDDKNYIYQWNNGSGKSVLAVRHEGDSTWATFNADVSDIRSTAPPAGTYNTSLANGYIRFGTEPTGVVTLDVEGDDSGTLGYKSDAAGIFRKILTERAGLSDTADLVGTSFTALESKTTAVVGYYWDKDINIDEAGDEVLAGISGWWAPVRDGRIAVGRIDDPATLTPEVTWEDIAGGSIITWEARPLSAEVRCVRVGYRPYSTVMTKEQIVSTVDLATRNDLGQGIRYVCSEVQGASADAEEITIPAAFDDPKDAFAEAKRLSDWLSKSPELVMFKLDTGSLDHFIGTVAQFKSSRYSQSAGRKAVVIGVGESLGTRTAVDSLEVTAVIEPLA